MQDWLTFFNLIFWLFVFYFFFQPLSFLKMVVCSEICWIILFLISSSQSIYGDNCFLINNLFYIFGLAAVEFVIGLLIMIYFLKNNNTLLLSKTNFDYTNLNKTNFNFNRTNIKK